MIPYKVIKFFINLVFNLLILILMYLIFSFFLVGMFYNLELSITSVSLFLGLTSLIISFLTYKIHLKNERPIIEVSFDFESRYYICQLKIENIGNAPAKNLKFNLLSNDLIKDTAGNVWDGNFLILKYLGSRQSQQKYIALRNQINFVSIFKLDIQYTDLSGFILYKDYVEIHLKDYDKSLDHIDEKTKAYYSISQISQSLSKIERILKDSK